MENRNMFIIRFKFDCALTLSLVWLIWTTTSIARESSGEVRLKSGVVAKYQYHFNRNSIENSLPTGDSLIALTSSKNLLLVDLKTLQPTREYFEAEWVSCIGRGEKDTVLAGLEDGRVCRVDPRSLKLIEVAKLPGAPTWLGVCPTRDSKGSGIVAVVEDKTIHDLSSGRTIELENPASTYFLDSKRRLWIGGRNFGHGCTCSRLDLESWILKSIEGIVDFEFDKKPKWDYIYGFIENKNGRVLAFGGGSGMGGFGEIGEMSGAFVRRVDESKIENIYNSTLLLYNSAIRANSKNKVLRESGNPTAAIHHILEVDNGSLLVFTSTRVYQTDSSFMKWKAGELVAPGNDEGRLELSGFGMPVCKIRSVHLDKASTEEIVCGTSSEGFVRIRDGKLTWHTIPDQLSVNYDSRIENTAEGPLVMAWENKESPNLFKQGRWVLPSFFPDWKLDPEESRKALPGNEQWEDVRVLIGRRGWVTTVCGSGNYPGTRVTARQSGSRIEILGKEVSRVEPSRTFMTPDGELWATDENNLSRFLRGKWQIVSKLPPVPPDEPEFKPSELGEFPAVGNGLLNVGKQVKTIGSTGPPWVLLDEDKGRLLQLSYGPDFKNPNLLAISLREEGKPLEVYDALEWTNGVVLFATDKGLRLYDLKQRRLSEFKTPPLGEEITITRLCRDGMRRLWVGGPGLWMIDLEANVAHDFSVLPMVGETNQIVALAADSRRRDGVLLIVGVRGVVFLQTSTVRGR